MPYIDATRKPYQQILITDGHKTLHKSIITNSVPSVDPNTVSAWHLHHLCQRLANRQQAQSSNIIQRHVSGKLTYNKNVKERRHIIQCGPHLTH